MRFLIDFFPIGLFFVAYKWHDIYVGTAVLMAATLVQTGIIYAIDRRLQPMHKATLVLVMVFGALTLRLHDQRFIMWKPTVLYAGMAIVLAAALWVRKKNVLQMLLGSHLSLPEDVWTRLTIAWIGYSLFMAALNGYVATFYAEEWMNFKLWGYIFPIAFFVGQGFYVARHLNSEEPGQS